MILTPENTYGVGHPVARITDANGLDWKDAVYLDTETGLLRYCVRDAEGHFVVEDRELVVKEVRVALPVVVRYKKPEG